MTSAALVEAIREGWGWKGIEPDAVTAISPFGHLIVRDAKKAFWYLDPELRTLEQVATDEAGLFTHMREPDVREVWEARALVDAAHARLGDPATGRCYTLNTLALLRGDYGHDNLCTMPVEELILFTGDFERQTHELPEGAQVQLKVVE
ncbi:T6SS immunity protein Tdi1 domain-containing protein [Sphingomonas sp. LT1P40]|uniref:T6SS immunity protein Tdi1 domain-containing protein n=1 Tax=Alteristakelama amylovorans TaxID=3096166 RepID=UPI002FC84F8D